MKTFPRRNKNEESTILEQKVECIFTTHGSYNTMTSFPPTDRPPPTPTAYLFATALVAVTLGYFIGQGSSLFFTYSKHPHSKPKSKTKKSWPNSYDVPIHPDTSDEELMASLHQSEQASSEPESESEEENNEVEEGDFSTFEGNNEECKLILVVRSDLGMGKGKIAAQCSHATLACYCALSSSSALKHPILKRWDRQGHAKIVTQVPSEEELLLLQAKALSLGLCAQVVRDAGRTQIASGSTTVLGVGPGPKSVVDAICRYLCIWRGKGEKSEVSIILRIDYKTINHSRPSPVAAKEAMSQLPDGKLAIPPRTLMPSPIPNQSFFTACHPQHPAQAALIRKSGTSSPGFPRMFSSVLTQLLRYQDLVNTTQRYLLELQYPVQRAVSHEKTMMTQADNGAHGQAIETRMEVPKMKESVIERALDMVFAYPVQLVLDLLEKMTPEQRGE
ncbi:MAG: hypothetical protein Q9167_006916, partial [Letrouitia subvulpina]